MVYIKILNAKKIMISSAALALLLSFSTGYSSTPREKSQEMVNYDDQLNPQSTTQLTPRNRDTFAITITPEAEDFDAIDINTKTKQMFVSAGATSVLGILTLYYACNTAPDTWISGTAGSFCANFLLTSMATDFLRRDRKNLTRRREAKK